VRAEYELSESASLLLNYLYESLDNVDYLNVQPATSPFYANEVLGADGDPSYGVHVGAVAFRMKF
jgi:hypothetical protein